MRDRDEWHLEGEAFHADAAWSEQNVVVTVRGEVDLVTRTALVDLLAGVVDSDPSHVRIDLSEVSFIDGRSTCEIVRIADHLTRGGVPVEIKSGPAFRRVVNILGLEDPDNRRFDDQR